MSENTSSRIWTFLANDHNLLVILQMEAECQSGKMGSDMKVHTKYQFHWILQCRKIAPIDIHQHCEDQMKDVRTVSAVARVMYAKNWIASVGSREHSLHCYLIHIWEARSREGIINFSRIFLKLMQWTWLEFIYIYIYV